MVVVGQGRIERSVKHDLTLLKHQAALAEAPQQIVGVGGQQQGAGGGKEVV